MSLSHEMNNIKNQLQLLEDGETKEAIEFIYKALACLADEVKVIKASTR